MKFINIGCYELYDKSVERELWREREGEEEKEGGARGEREREREKEREERKKRWGDASLLLLALYDVYCQLYLSSERYPRPGMHSDAKRRGLHGARAHYRNTQRDKNVRKTIRYRISHTPLIR